MPIFSRLIFYVVRWSACRGLHDADAHNDAASLNSRFEKKEKARRTGMRGETYGYWYLRRHGYVFVAKNYMPVGAKGELDLVGYDGETLAFVEIRTRTIPDRSPALPAMPELSVTHSKQAVLVRTAQRFLSDRHLRDCPTRFDILAIDNIPGQSPVVRLHKDAFSPQLHR
ncbi:MAG: YraN family protein [Candidatus Acidiferrum sp.]